MKIALQFVILVFAFVGRTLTAETPQLFAKSEGGWADAELRADKVEVTSAGEIVITASARAGNDEVGIRLRLPAKWEPWTPNGFPGQLFRGTVRIESLGGKTETFVRVLAAAYGQKVERYEFAGVTLTAISLGGDPREARTIPIKLKVFCERQKEEEYAEAFLNFDLPHGIVQFHEKDQEYRKAIIAFLTRNNG